MPCSLIHCSCLVSSAFITSALSDLAIHTASVILCTSFKSPPKDPGWRWRTWLKALRHISLSVLRYVLNHSHPGPLVLPFSHLFLHTALPSLPTLSVLLVMPQGSSCDESPQPFPYQACQPYLLVTSSWMLTLGAPHWTYPEEDEFMHLLQG